MMCMFITVSVDIFRFGLYIPTIVRVCELYLFTYLFTN